MKRALLPALLLLAPAFARADAPKPTTFMVDAAKSSLSYKIVHKFHEVEGKTSKVTGVALVGPDVSKVQVKVDVASFDSGNSNRDDHMKETVEASKYPEAQLKGVVKDLKLPASYPGDAKATLDGILEFHGQPEAVKVPLDIHFDSAQHAHAKANFKFSLDQHKVERPSLMMVKIDDDCQVGVDLDLNAK